MKEPIGVLKDIENQIESALWEFEVHEQLDQALAIYKTAEIKLESLGLQNDDPSFAEQQRVMSYCLMRQGNILRQMGKPQAALAMGEREITAARASADEITLARALMSNGTNLILAGDVGGGLQLIEESREHLARGSSYDHTQMLGWYWILKADLSNAGLTKHETSEIIEFATQAISILKPIENWPGVARAFAARAKAYERLGKAEQAGKDKEEQKFYESKISPEERSE
jgi:tetratricopeptide (TPR) repeat protein